MNWEEMIEAYSKENGILTWGICSPEPFDSLRKELEQKNSFLKGFVEQNITLRIDPKQTMPEVKSIFVFALGYKKRFLFQTDGRLRGAFSMGAIGLDYHIVLKEKIEKLAEKLSSIFSFQYQIYVDTGPLCDRALAERAGIGYFTKNGSLCSPFGSMIFLGYMMTDWEVPVFRQKKKEKKECGSCRACIDICPGSAIGEDGTFYFERCVSYLTQKKGTLTKAEGRMIGKQLYGCDLCQTVCPRNQNQPYEPISDLDSSMPDLTEVLFLSNKEFQMRFGKTAIGWRGKNVIQRNALWALSNQPDVRSETILKKFCLDQREMIRETAETALINWREQFCSSPKEEVKWDTGIPEDCEEVDWKN